MDIINYFGGHPPLVVLILFGLILLFVPVTEEMALLIGGFLSARIEGAWPLTLLCGFIGIVITDVWGFLLGRWFGAPILRSKWIGRFISQKRILKARELVEKHGVKIVFIVRFIPGGLRIPTFVVCGLSGVKLWRFILFSSLGALIVMHISFWIGYSLGGNIDIIKDIATTIEEAGKLVSSIILVFVLTAILFFLVRRRLKRKNNAEAVNEEHPIQ